MVGWGIKWREEREKKISLRNSKSLFCVLLGWDGKEESIMRENRKRKEMHKV